MTNLNLRRTWTSSLLQLNTAVANGTLLPFGECRICWTETSQHISRAMRRLEIDIQQPEWTMRQQRPENLPLASWIQKLDNLEELSLVLLDTQRPFFSVFDLFTGVTSPRLRLLSLEFEGIERKDFNRFVERHQLTLRLMHINIIDQSP